MEPHIPVPIENNGVIFVILLLCVCLVAFFSSSEAALIAVNRIRLKNLVEKGDKNAKAVEKVVNNHDKLFATILATENMVIIFASSLAGVLAVNLFGEKGLAISTIVMTIFIVIFGEITPKTFAAQNALKISLLVARPIAFIIKILSPIISILAFISKSLIRLLGGNPMSNPYILTEDEIRMVINDGAKEGVLNHSERQMIEGIFDFSKTTAGEIMVPRVDMVTLAHTASLADAVKIVTETGHSRLPVRKESADNILGVIYAKDILKKVKEDLDTILVTDIIRECHFAPESQSIVSLLTELREKKTTIAIIVDEFGGTAGLVSIETLLEEIVGDIDDEFDVPKCDFIKSGEDEFVASAKMNIYSVKECLGIELPEGDYQTLGGFVISLIESIPSKGDSAEFGNYEYIVEATEDYRLSKIRIKPKKNRKK